MTLETACENTDAQQTDIQLSLSRRTLSSCALRCHGCCTRSPTGPRCRRVSASVVAKRTLFLNVSRQSCPANSNKRTKIVTASDDGRATVPEVRRYFAGW